MKYQAEVVDSFTPQLYQQYMQLRARNVRQPVQPMPLRPGPLTLVATHLSAHTPELNVQARLLQERLMQSGLMHQVFAISPDTPYVEPFVDGVALQCYEVPGINTPHHVSQRLALLGWDVRACMYQTFKFLLSTPGEHLEFHVPYGPAEDAKYNDADTAQEANYHLAMSMDLYLQGAADLRGGGRVALNGVPLEEIGEAPDRTSIHFYTSTEQYLAQLLQQSECR